MLSSVDWTIFSSPRGTSSNPTSLAQVNLTDLFSFGVVLELVVAAVPDGAVVHPVFNRSSENILTKLKSGFRVRLVRGS